MKQNQQATIHIPIWMSAQRLCIIETPECIKVRQDSEYVVRVGLLGTVVILAAVALLASQVQLSLEVLLAIGSICIFCLVILFALGRFFHNQPALIEFDTSQRSLIIPRHSITTTPTSASMLLKVEYCEDSEGRSLYPVLAWWLRPSAEPLSINLYICQRQKHLRAIAREFASRVGCPVEDTTDRKITPALKPLELYSRRKG